MNDDPSNPFRDKELDIKTFIDLIRSEHPLFSQENVFGFRDALLPTYKIAIPVNKENAVKYGADGGHVVLAASFQERNVLIRVEDDGPGIPEEHREKIFEPFTQEKVGCPECISWHRTGYEHCQSAI